MAGWSCAIIAFYCLSGEASSPVPSPAPALPRSSSITPQLTCFPYCWLVCSVPPSLPPHHHHHHHSGFEGYAMLLQYCCAILDYAVSPACHCMLRVKLLGDE